MNPTVNLEAAFKPASTMFTSFVRLNVFPLLNNYLTICTHRNFLCFAKVVVWTNDFTRRISRRRNQLSLLFKDQTERFCFLLNTLRKNNKRIFYLYHENK